MFQIFAITFIIAFLGYLIQIFPRFFNRKFGVDVWTRLLEIDLVRQNNHKIPGKIDKRFIIGGNFDYPPVFPILLSYISKKRLEKIQGFIAPFFDAVLGLILYLFIFNITGNFWVAVISQIAYILTPVTALENSYLTPRSLGYLLMSTSLLCLILFHLSHDYLFILISLILTVLLYLSHRFALQSLIFGSIFFSLIDLSIWYFVTIFIGFIITILITHGYYGRVLEGHLANIKFWIVYGKYRFAHQVHGLKEFKKQSDFIGIIYLILQKATPLALFGLNLWMVFPVGLLVISINKNIVLDPLIYRLSLWVIFYYLFSILVMSSKKLLPIGEGQRYLEMCAFAAATTSGLITFSYGLQFPLVIYLFIIIAAVNLVLIILAQWKAVIKDINRTVTTTLDEAFKFINNLPGTPKIICIPHQNTTMTLYHTKADVLVNADNLGLMKLDGIYPVLTKPINDIVREFRCNYLLLRTTFSTLKDLNLKKPNIVFQKSDIAIIKLS